MFTHRIMRTIIEPSTGDSPEIDQRGGRLLPTWIDKVGQDAPDKVWASVPRSANLKDGFRDLRYRHLVAAIDAAAWWIESVIGRSTNFETVAYLGYIAVMTYPCPTYLILVLFKHSRLTI